MKKIAFLLGFFVSQYTSAVVFSGEALQNGDLQPVVLLDEYHAQDELKRINCRDKALWAKLNEADNITFSAFKRSSLKVKATNAITLIESWFPGDQSVPDNIGAYYDNLHKNGQELGFLGRLYVVLRHHSPHVHAIDSRYAPRAFLAALKERLNECNPFRMLLSPVHNNRSRFAVSFSDVLDELDLRCKELAIIGKTHPWLNDYCAVVIQNITACIYDLKHRFYLFVLSKNSEFNLSVTPDDTVDRYTQVHATFYEVVDDLIYKKYVDVLAEMCNLIMLDKILKAQEQNRPVVVIAGAFHTKRIKAILEQYAGYHSIGSLAARNNASLESIMRRETSIIDCGRKLVFPTKDELRTFLDAHDGISTKMATKIQATYRGMKTRQLAKQLKQTKA